MSASRPLCILDVSGLDKLTLSWFSNRSLALDLEGRLMLAIRSVQNFFHLLLNGVKSFKCKTGVPILHHDLMTSADFFQKRPSSYQCLPKTQCSFTRDRRLPSYILAHPSQVCTLLLQSAYRSSGICSLWHHSA